jgi:DegV family protein with EDD domain
MSAGSPRGVVGLCTDSSAQLPPDLADRFGVEIVPLTVVVDDDEHLEGIDLDADGFYARFGPDHRPTVATSQPSPGQFAMAYDALAERGCTEILSIHVSSAVSGTINAARLAARHAAVPVRLVDSGTASFGVSCCVWAAAEALAAGACLDVAAKAAESLAPTIGNVFVVGALDLLAAGGRAGGDIAEEAARIAAGDTADEAIPVLSLRDGQVEVLERVGTPDAAVRVMAAYLAGWGQDVRVAIGHADRQAEPLTDALVEAVRSSADVAEVVRYRVGPSVGAHTGPGTVGGFVFPGRFPVSSEPR